MARIRGTSLGTLYDQAEQGVVISGLHKVTRLALLPSPGAITLEVFADASPSDGRLQDGATILNQGILLQPGCEVQFEQPLQNFVTIRPYLLGSFAYTQALSGITKYYVPEVDGTGTAPPYSDAKLMDRNASIFLMAGDKLSNWNVQLYKPASLKIAALGNAATPTGAQLQNNGNGLTALRLLWPWSVAPLEIVRRYRRMRLIICQSLDTSLANNIMALTVVDGIPGPLYQAWLGSVASSALAYANSCKTVADFGPPSDLQGVFSAATNYGATLSSRSASNAGRLQAWWELDDGEPVAGQIQSLLAGNTGGTLVAGGYIIVHGFNDGNREIQFTGVSLGGATGITADFYVMGQTVGETGNPIVDGIASVSSTTFTSNTTIACPRGAFAMALTVDAGAGTSVSWQQT